MTRLNQYLTAATSLSRRAADAAIAAGRVTINGLPAGLGTQVEKGSTVALDGQVVTPSSTHTYLMLHKPAGYISSRTRQGTDPIIYDLLPRAYHHLRAAGRLDRDSSGLMLLSDDGQFIQRLTHPSFGKTKTYELTLARPLTSTDIKTLQAGIQLNDGPSRPRVLRVNGPHVTVTLGEGRNRQLRRTFGALGYGIITLHRTAIGPYHLGNLHSGQFQTISP
jgi:pseudouridine synthase